MLTRHQGFRALCDDINVIFPGFHDVWLQEPGEVESRKKREQLRESLSQLRHLADTWKQQHWECNRNSQVSPAMEG